MCDIAYCIIFKLLAIVFADLPNYIRDLGELNSILIIFACNVVLHQETTHVMSCLYTCISKETKQ